MDQINLENRVHELTLELEKTKEQLRLEIEEKKRVTEELQKFHAQAQEGFKELSTAKAQAAYVGGTTGQPQENQSTFVDLSQISKYNDALRLKLINTFLESAPIEIEKIQLFAASKQKLDLIQTARHLRGSSVAVGARRMSQLCDTLQRLGEQGNLSQFDTTLDQLMRAYEYTVRTLEGLKKKA